MRSVETWEKRMLPKQIKKFTPRIQRDLKSIEWPKNLPKKLEDLFLYGDTKTGKTIYAAFLYLQHLKLIYLAGDTSDQSNLFVSFPEMFIEIKKTFEKNSTTTEFEVIEKYKNADLLILDDFGVKNSSDWFLEILYVIINHRYEYLKTTIYTSNFSLDELTDVLGDDRISSRIERQCKVIEKKKWKK